MRLAELAGISIESGWIGKLAKHLDIKEDNFRKWIDRGAPDHGLYQIEKKGYPARKWMLDESYEQDEQHMLAPGQGHDSRREFGQPDFTDHRVKEIIASLTPTELDLIEALREIDLISRTGIYSAAITQLNEAKREKETRKNKKKKELLDRAINSLSKAISTSTK